MRIALKHNDLLEKPFLYLKSKLDSPLTKGTTIDLNIASHDVMFVVEGIHAESKYNLVILSISTVKHDEEARRLGIDVFQKTGISLSEIRAWALIEASKS